MFLINVFSPRQWRAFFLVLLSLRRLLLDSNLLKRHFKSTSLISSPLPTLLPSSTFKAHSQQARFDLSFPHWPPCPSFAKISTCKIEKSRTLRGEKTSQSTPFHPSFNHSMISQIVFIVLVMERFPLVILILIWQCN